MCIYGMICQFQSTHPRGVRPFSQDAASKEILFQSTHPRGVRQVGDHIAHRPANFNPRTRVGCDAWMECEGDREKISIHAPAWGATQAGISLPVADGFQSTHPRGVRRRFPRKDHSSYSISIHAPAWGATHLLLREMIPLINFNPRTRVGCDISNFTLIYIIFLFQSTHPRGVRLKTT